MSIDAAILELAAHNLGLVTTGQLYDLGLTKDQVHARVRSGMLTRVHRGIYRVASSQATSEQFALAGCLTAGGDAFASHSTALVLLRLHNEEPPSLEVTAPVSVRRRHPGLIVHRSALVGPRERFRNGPLPIARPARALIDVAGRFEPDLLETLVDRALRSTQLTPRVLATEARRPEFDRRPGIQLLRRLASMRVDTRGTESELEDLTLRLLRRYGLPEPVRQLSVTARGRSVRFDLAYPDQQLAVELDGWAPHYGRAEWERDHARHNATELSGWRTLRFTWWDVTERPISVVLAVAEALGIRPTRRTVPTASAK